MPPLAQPRLLFAGETPIGLAFRRPGAESAAGFALANARSTFDSAGLYAWTLLILLLVAALEFLLLQPLQRRMGRWQEAAHA